MLKRAHILESDLIRFADGEMHGASAANVSAHLQQCTQCRARMDELQNAFSAYADYHARVLKPSFNVTREWPPLNLPVAESPKRQASFWSIPAWTTAAALLCLALVAFFLYRDAPSRTMRHLLTRAATVPAPRRERLQVIANGRSWYRPAVLRDAAGSAMALEHTKALFVKANYNWNDPLSPRSFAEWRNHLRNKRDQVTSVGVNDNRFYRLQTDTSQGILRTASLTLRADTLHPVEGSFHFEGHEDVTMTDAGPMPAALPSITERKSAIPVVESKVSPEEELRVFAALNAIGADAGDPVTVYVDPSHQHIVVSAIGLPGIRQREIQQALAQLPHTVTQFESRNSTASGKIINQSDLSPAGALAPLRRELELKSGGAQALQNLTDRALDASSSLLAQSHALSVLAQTFPPAVESRFHAADAATLRSLRKKHTTAIQQSIMQLHAALAPLLVLPSQSQGSSVSASWQTIANELTQKSKQLDDTLSRLLAGSYSQQSGEDLLSQLPDTLQSVENLAREEQAAS